MIACCPVKTCVKNVTHLSGVVQKDMTNWIYGVTPQARSFFCFSVKHLKPKYVDMSVSKANHYPASIGCLSFPGSCFRPSISKQRSNLHESTVRSMFRRRHPLKTFFGKSLGCENMTLRLVVPKQGKVPKSTGNMGFSSWLRGFVSGGLAFGLLVCFSTSEQVHAEEPLSKKHKDEDRGSSSVSLSHGKQVYTDYSIIGIPGDGRCLFRSVAHGACVRSGKPAPNESIQRKLADELRARVADEFIKRRKETEWFIEGDFDSYVSQIRKPLVWGGEPELLMASHVLQMPITVFMYDEDSGGLISIAEYGQEEYGKENPIKVLYHGFGHYDALHISDGNGSRSRL